MRYGKYPKVTCLTVPFTQEVIKIMSGTEKRVSHRKLFKKFHKILKASEYLLAPVTFKIKNL
jgi:hypothetical protein